MQYSSFWNMYLYNPESSVYILFWHPEGRQGVYRGHRPPAHFINGPSILLVFKCKASQILTLSPTLLLKSLTMTPSLTIC